MDDFEKVTQNCLLALAQGIKSKTNIKYYDESIRADKFLKRKLINDFEEALENNKLTLLWQPQYDVKSKQVLSVEVFARWQHPDNGLILPSVFIPLLEKSNRICQLSNWIVEEVLEKLPSLQKQLPEAEVSVNLSPRDLLTGNFIKHFDENLSHYSPLTKYIVLEISESIMVNDYSIALDNIKQLQLRGFKISIEKFGSGLASFAYLQSIPTNELKIDKSFSDRFAEPKTHAILSNIIQLAKRLEIRLVVEGLETQQQVKVFADLDVDRIQGWAISKPLTLEALLNDITIRKLERSLVNSADISTLYDGQEIQKTTQRICSDPH